MKKTLVILSIIFVIGAVSAFTYAETLTPTTQSPRASFDERENWFKERIQWKKNQINESLKEGLITKEEAKTWDDHFKYMEKFHNENGFMPGCNGMGCGNGLGLGKMRGNRWNR
jgi:hypothetical protein